MRHTARTSHKTSRPTTWNSPRPRRDAEKFWAKTETRPETYWSKTETLSTLSETRLRRNVVRSRDCLETETSRPRPHPCMQTIYTLLQTDNHNTTSLNFYRPDSLPDAQPTLSKHWRPYYICNNKPHLAFIQWRGHMIIRNASPGCIQTNGIVYCPINSSPMKSSSSTANRISANSGRFMWNSKLSSNIGLAANIQVQSAKKIPVYFKALQHF